MKFEAGKSYRNPGNDGVVFECVWADDTHVALRYRPVYRGEAQEPCVTASLQTCWQHFQEIRPRIKRIGWVNVYPDRTSAIIKDKETADKYATPGRIACVKIEIDCEEGEGL